MGQIGFGALIATLFSLGSMSVYGDIGKGLIQDEQNKNVQAFAQVCELQMNAFGGPVDKEACLKSARSRLGYQ